MRAVSFTHFWEHYETVSGLFSHNVIDNEYASNVYYRETKLTSFLLLLIFQSRFPDLNITEEDLVNAEKELEELTKENEDSEKPAEKTPNANIPEIIETLEEDKKDL